jgi:hypothetical protein
VRLAPGGGSLSDHYGFDGGTPVDRPYIEAFLNARRDAIRGRVLEVDDSTYTIKFGADRVAESVWTDRANENAAVKTTLGPLEQIAPGTSANLLHHAWVLTRITGHVVYD